jgi:hypothetical protein
MQMLPYLYVHQLVLPSCRSSHFHKYGLILNSGGFETRTVAQIMLPTIAAVGIDIR